MYKFFPKKIWYNQIFIFVICTFFLIISCKQKQQQAALPPADVKVTHVKKQTVPIWLEYIGITTSIKTVDIRARVAGFLEKHYFTEGAIVKKGDKLFTIDPKPFIASLDKSKAQLAKDRASFAYNQLQMKRYKSLAKKDLGSKSDYDQYKAQADEARADIQADKAAIETAQLNLGYCTMFAPFEGRIGRTAVHEGNLVGAGEETKLATIVKLDPIYVYFSPSSKDFYKILVKKQKGDLPVKIDFSDGSDTEYKGKIDFIDNTIDSTTGTITMRAIINNPDKKLLPGIYVNVNLFIRNEPNTILIPQKAISVDQSGSYVFVVEKDNKAQRKNITTALEFGSNIMVTKGLTGGETLIIEGLQKIRPGSTVNAQFVHTDEETSEKKQSSSKK